MSLLSSFKIENTADFQKALDNSLTEKAENFLDKIANNRDKYPQYDDRWLDHRQAELFNKCLDIRDIFMAKRIVENTKNSHSQQGRKKRLENFLDKQSLSYEELHYEDTPSDKNEVDNLENDNDVEDDD